MMTMSAVAVACKEQKQYRHVSHLRHELFDTALAEAAVWMCGVLCHFLQHHSAGRGTPAAR